MFKRLNRVIIVCFLLIGTCSSVFAVSLFTQLDKLKNQIKDSASWISSIFAWSSQVSNLYQKALSLSKEHEVASTTISLDQLKSYYNECNGLTNDDFVNVLYNSNASFWTTMSQISITDVPSRKQINDSYAKFFACRGIFGLVNNKQLEALNNEINLRYYNGYANSYMLDTLNEDNFGADLFWNGTLDDSDFDLLYDIDQIGKVFFEDFKESPQVLFYRLPQVEGAITQNGSDLSSLSDQGSYQVGNGWWSFSPSATSSPSTPSSSATSSSSSQQQPSANTPIWSTNTSSATSSVATDRETQTFVAATNTPAIAGDSSLGNQCLTWSEVDASVQEEQPVFQNPAEYIAGIVDFINSPNIDTIIATQLLQEFKENTPLPPWASSSDPAIADAIANTYAEQAFGEAQPGTCSYACRNLSLTGQTACEVACSKSCIQTCIATGQATKATCVTAYDQKILQCNQFSWLKKTSCIAAAKAQKIACNNSAITQQALCVSDCTCFMVAWPSGAWWEKIEDMYRIKFCKVPVQSKKVSPWKTVFSIQAIFQEISDVLEWLKNSGQMVKFSATKEYLDGTIKMNLADNFAFQLLFSFKPLFVQVATTTKLKEQEQDMRDFSLGIMGMNVGAPEADDYNKYIVISDPVVNDANMQQATSLNEINQNIDAFAAAVAAAKTTAITWAILDDVLATYGNKTANSIVQNMIIFLQDNQAFWNDLSLSLLDMTRMSIELKSKIENSK